MKNKIFKGLAFFALTLCMCKACTMDYAYEVIDSMSEEVYMRIKTEFPGLNDVGVAEFYVSHQDSIEAEIAAEEQYEAFLQTLKYN